MDGFQRRTCTSIQTLVQMDRCLATNENDVRSSLWRVRIGSAGRAVYGFLTRRHKLALWGLEEIVKVIRGLVFFDYFWIQAFE